MDIDGVLVLADSENRDATTTWKKKTFGRHPLTAFVDHGSGGSGETVASLLWPGTAGSNTASDHIGTARLALAQLPKGYRLGRWTRVRTESGGGTHEFLSWPAKPGRRLTYAVGMAITEAVRQAVLEVPASAWTPAGLGNRTRRRDPQRCQGRRTPRRCPHWPDPRDVADHPQ